MQRTAADPLETVLLSVRPHAVVLGALDLSWTDVVAGPTAAQLQMLAPRRGDQVISLYHVVSGAAQLGIGRPARQPLQAGQAILLLDQAPYVLRAVEVPGRDCDDRAPACRLVAVHYAIDRLLLQSWADRFPQALTLDWPAETPWLVQALQAAARETDRPGALALAARVAETALCEAVRWHLAENCGDAPPLPVAADRIVSRCLALMHQKLGSPWTVERLAAEAGASRSILAERFTRHVGASPMAYLQKLRLEWASQCLRSTSLSVSHVASSVGYETDAAFNRAFRRAYGAPPGAWRRGHGRAGAAA